MFLLIRLKPIQWINIYFLDCITHVLTIYVS